MQTKQEILLRAGLTYLRSEPYSVIPTFHPVTVIDQYYSITFEPYQY